MENKYTTQTYTIRATNDKPSNADTIIKTLNSTQTKPNGIIESNNEGFYDRFDESTKKKRKIIIYGPGTCTSSNKIPKNKIILGERKNNGLTWEDINALKDGLGQ